MAPTSKWLFVLGLPRRNREIVPVWILRTLRGHNYLLRPPIGMRWSKIVASSRELSNGVSQSTCTHRGQVDSRLLMVGSQIANLIPGPSFRHNLWCKCPNGPCEAIFDIYTLIAFQWYKKHPNARCLALCNRTLKFQESRRTPMSQLWECEFHPHTLSK
jgi:hypothetical protein